ncbi:MAG: ATP-binding protein [Chlamydiia bacterium]|nr:ATP-binding protein [Chlamydiia bacterium]
MEERKSFEADLRQLHPMLTWIREHLEQTSLSDIERIRIEIALEEGLVNIISYAYQSRKGSIEIIFRHVAGDFVELELYDQGLPFNPLSVKKEADPLVPVEEREVGGLGILFMQKLMDKVEYQRVQECNVLTLQKKLS